MTNKTPMPDTDTLDTLLAAWNDGDDAPDALRGQVSMDEAYALQLALLNRHLNAAVAQGGWKLGQTNAALRAQRGETAPAPGFLLRENQVDAGTTLTLDGPDNWFIEPELVFVMGADLQGAKFTTNFKKVRWFYNATFSEDQIPWVVLNPKYPEYADTLKWVKAEADAA